MCLIGFVVAAAAGPVAVLLAVMVGMGTGVGVGVAVAVDFGDAVAPEGAGVGVGAPDAVVLGALDGVFVTFTCGPGVPMVAPPSHAVKSAVTLVRRESARTRAVRSRNNNVCK